MARNRFIDWASRAVVCGLILVSPALGGTFSYPNFASLAGLDLNGNAAQQANRVRLTMQTLESGSVFRTTTEPISGGFETTFSFIINGITPDFADGLAFVIQNDPSGSGALGLCCGQIGYGGMTNSLAIEFDTFLNAGWNDPNANHIGVQSCGAAENTADHDTSCNLGLAATPGSPAVPGGISLTSAMRTARIVYAGTTLTVYLTDDGNVERQVLQVTNLDLGSLVGSSAYVGFTASTGDAASYHDIISWTWNSAGDEEPTFGTPEPSSWLLSGAGALFLALARRRKVQA